MYQKNITPIINVNYDQLAPQEKFIEKFNLPKYLPDDSIVARSKDFSPDIKLDISMSGSWHYSRPTTRQ